MLSLLKLRLQIMVCVQERARAGARARKGSNMTIYRCVTGLSCNFRSWNLAFLKLQPETEALAMT